MSAPPNPAVSRAITALTNDRGKPLKDLRIADQGCGKLRHYKLLRPLARELYLVDTKDQLDKPHADRRVTYTVRQFATQASRRNNLRVIALPATDFQQSTLDLDLVFSIAVCDVIPSRIRRTIIADASGNLKPHGYFVLIVPRNDVSITSRCTNHNRHDDGHAFAHHGIHTFYRNFSSTKPLINQCRRNDLLVVDDLSVYRQICIIFTKE